LAGLIRDTKIGTRFELEQKEAEREGPEEGLERQDGQAAEDDELAEDERGIAVETARREEALEVACEWLQEMFGDETVEMHEERVARS
jgi:hypothetical protein